MFKKLSIVNFQSHADSSFEFSPFVNVIQGLSTVGKTAVLRALRLLIDNRPSGGRFFSNFAGDKGETKITLDLDNGQIVVVKSIKVSADKKEVKATHYYLDIAGKKFSFTGVGESVPDDVKKILNLSELNVQRQFDMPFLVSSSAGEIARVINRITNLEKVDDWVSSLTSKINESNRSIVLLEDELKSARIDLDKYDGLDDTDQVVKDLLKTQGELTSLLSVASRLDRELISYEEKYRSQEPLRELIKAEKYIAKAEKIRVDDDRIFYRALSDLCEKGRRLDSAHEELVGQYESLKDEYVAVLEKSGRCPGPLNCLLTKKQMVEMRGGL